ncbi:MAG: hypothetical protein P4L90_20650 [Rhodopila sp.]|nr:hypothetical protein [Rhodopila sp.]
MAADLATALSDAAVAGDAWTAQRITLGKETVLEGEALRRAIQEAACVVG